MLAQHGAQQGPLGEVLAELLVSETRRQGAGVIVTSVGNRLGLPYDKIFAL